MHFLNISMIENMGFRIHIKSCFQFFIKNILPTLFGLIVIAIVISPVLSLLINGPFMFDVASEFVSYRVSDALSILFEETKRVLPVQGLATALVSKIIIKGLYFLYGERLLQPNILQLYSVGFFAIIGSMTFVFIAKFWLRFNWMQKVSLAIFALIPWFLTPTNMLLPTPEYWFGEYVFLLCSLALLYIIHNGASNISPLLIGMWVGLGISIKINIIGVAPIFFLAHKEINIRNAVFMLCGAVVSYLSIIYAYSGFNLTLATNIFKFQYSFFFHPNKSFMYSKFSECILNNLIFVFLLFNSALIIFTTNKKRVLQSVAAFLWVAMYVLMVSARLHQTSIASALLGFIFITCYLGSIFTNYTRFISLVVFGSAVSFMCCYIGSPYVPYRLFNKALRQEFNFTPKGMLFIPNNYWNARFPVQAFGYNGQLGLYPSGVDDKGEIKYECGGKVFQKFFNGVLLVGHNEQDWNTIQAGILSGAPLHWAYIKSDKYPTDAMRDIDIVLKQKLKMLGATIVEKEVSYQSNVCIVGSAQKVVTPAK
jgi:hypothetical protein